MPSAQFSDDRGNYLALDEIKVHADQVDCIVEVSSHGFSYRGRQFFDTDSLQDAVARLESMYETLEGTCEIGNRYEDNRITISVQKLGHVRVGGTLTLYGEHMNQLKFEYRTDQTVLYGFWQGLRRALCGEREE